MQLKYLGAMALFCGLAMSFTVNANAQTERTISVMGTSTTQVVPDLVVWKISTTSSSQNLTSAKNESDRKIKAVLATAHALGISPKDTQTGHLAIQRIYEHGKFPTQRGATSYRVTRDVSLIQRDATQFDKVLTRLIQATDMEVRYTLESSQLTFLRDQTRLNAVKAAQNKASEMAGALGVKLGRVLSINEDAHRGDFHQPITNSVNFHQHEEKYGRFRGVPPEQPTLAPGTIDLKVSVAAVFELR